MATFTFRGRSIQLPDPGRIAPSRRTSSIIPPPPNRLAQQETPTPTPANPRAFDWGTPTRTNDWGAPTGANDWGTPTPPQQWGTPQQTSPFDPAQRPPPAGDSDRTLYGFPTEGLLGSWLPESEGTGLGSALYNKAIRPLASPVGVGMVGVMAGATALAPLIGAGALVAKIGGVAAAAFGGAAALRAPKEWREYQEAKASGDQKRISSELADLYIGGAEILGGAIAPVAAFRGVSKAQLLGKMGKVSQDLNKRAAAYETEWAGHTSAVRKTKAERKVIAGEETGETYYHVPKEPAFFAYDDKMGEVVSSYVGRQMHSNKDQVRITALQHAERDYMVEQILNKAQGVQKDIASGKSIYNKYSLDEMSDMTAEAGIITKNPHLIKAAQTVKSEVAGLTQYWEYFKPLMFQSGRETLLRMGRTHTYKKGNREVKEFVKDPNGERLTYMLDSSTHMSRRLANTWEARADGIIKGLKRGELDQIPALIEGTKLRGGIDLKSPEAKLPENWDIPDAPEHIKAVVSRLQDLFAEMGEMAMATGVRVKKYSGERKKFKKESKEQKDRREEQQQAGKFTDRLEDELGVEKFEAWGRDYWPRLLPTGRIGSSRIKDLAVQIQRAAKEQGKDMPWQEAMNQAKSGVYNTVVDKAAPGGGKGSPHGIEWVTPQHQRHMDAQHAGAFKYRTDMGVIQDHIVQIASITAQTKHFGPVAMLQKNKWSPLRRAMESLYEPGRRIRTVSEKTGKSGSKIEIDAQGSINKSMAERIVSTQLDALDRHDMSVRIIGAATNYQMVTKLSYHYISNFAANTQTILRSEGLSSFKALGRYFTDAKRSHEIADLSGARTMIMSAMVEGATKHGKFAKSVAKWFGINLAENRERRYASNVGEGTVKYLYKQFKSGNINKSETAKLKDLLGKDDIDLMRYGATNEKLGDAEIYRAAGRFSEMVQGLSEGKNLPIYWTESTLLQIPLQFKKFAFQGTKTIKDSLIEHPVRNTAALALLSQLFGEAVGSTKATITGTTRGITEALIEGKPQRIPQQVEKAVEKELGYRRELDLDILGEGEVSDNISWVTANLVDSWVAGLAADALMASARGAEGVESWIWGPTAEDLKYGIDAAYGAAYGGAQMLRGEEPTWGYMKPFARQVGRSIPFWGRGGQRATLPTPKQEYGSSSGRGNRRSLRTRRNRL